jgi:1,2-diacylglycerol 3-beta-galactosyltransferase
VPFVTVVTDLASVHPLWLHPQADACYVATEEARRAALAAGLDAARVHVLGLPIRPAFAQPYPPGAKLKRTLGLAPDRPAVLLMGGGDGVGPVETIAHALDDALAPDDGQIVVICGRNEALRARLTAHAWSVPARILGFVDEMPAWMHACDALVTKAGPGTIAEAFICGLPLLLSGFIPGQEEGNVGYVVEHGAGAFERDPRAIARTIAAWFGPQAAARARMAENARRLGRPQATFDIVASIAGLLP